MNTPDPYQVPTGPGWTDLPIAEARLRLHADHAAHAAIMGCDAHPWYVCQSFAVARLTGIAGQTIYVIHDPVSMGYRVVQMWTEGPSGAIGAAWGQVIPSWGDAVLAALRVLLGNPEFAETVQGATALAIAARALAEADAMSRRYQP